MSRHVFTTLTFAFLLHALPVAAQDASVVTNPETPAEGRERVVLNELWSVGGYDEDILFGVISQLAEDPEGNVYLLDSQLNEIQVLSPGGEYLRTIGREGEGPGEFRNASDMFFGPGGLVGVLQVFPGKIIQLTPTGEPADNFPLPEVTGFQLVFVARGLPDRVALAGAITGDGEQTTYLKAFDGEGTQLAVFHEQTDEMIFGGMKFKEKVNRNFTQRWALADDGRVAAALEFDPYTIHVWKPDGSVDHIITRPDYPQVTRTDDERKLIQTLFDGFTSWNPGSTYETSRTHMTVAQVTFRDDGTLWVMGSQGLWRTDDDVFASFDVYDLSGSFLKTVDLIAPGDPVYDAIFFSGNRAYIVTESLNALMASMGQEGEESAEEEAEPIRIIAYELGEPIKP